MHQVLTTTHTVEMAQIDDLNQRLAAHRPEVLTAAELGLAGTATAPSPASPLAGEAVLLKLHWDGSPEYPYIHGAFSEGGRVRTAMLHTRALRELSHRLHAHHLWGVGSAPEPQDTQH